MQSPKAAGGPYSRRLRQIHAILLSLVAALAVSGTIYYFRRQIGLGDAKFEIMFAHAVIGYALIAAVFWRIAMLIFGDESERARHLFVRPKDLARLAAKSQPNSARLKFAGRSPLSRTLATMLYAVIASNIVTGLVFATTDLYFPPFGGPLLEYVAADNAEPTVENVRSGGFDQGRMSKVRKFKRPFATVHLWGAILIATLALFHVVGVTLTEWSAPNNKLARGRARLMLFGPREDK
jgi:cytochrome b